MRLTTLPGADPHPIATWSPGPDYRAPRSAAARSGHALTVRMEPANRRAAGRMPEDTRMAALWHVSARVVAGDILLVQSADRRRVGRVGETLFRYFRTEGGSAVVFDFEVANAADIAALGLEVWQRCAPSGPVSAPVELIAIGYDLPLSLGDEFVYPGDTVRLPS